MGICSEAICKHRILFPSIQHLARLPHAGASPGKTIMWAAVRENGNFLTVVNYTIFAAIIDSFMSN